MRKKRILFLPVGLGLAHVGRACVVAKELKMRGYDVYLGVGKHSSIVSQMEGIPFAYLPEISVNLFNRSFVRLNPSIISVKMMEEFVKKELALFKKYKPDLVVADTRPSARISTLVANLPLVVMTNVDATPFYDFEKTKINLPHYWSKSLPNIFHDFLEKEPGQKAMAKIAPLFLKAITTGQLLNYNLVMIKYGQKPFSNVFKFLIGDLTLLLDIPEFRPVKKIESNVRVVGPIFWEGVQEKPSWSSQLQNKTTLYITASGTGDKKIFQKIINFLSDTPFQVVATTGNTCCPKEIKFPKRKDFFITDFLPGSWIMKKASLIIFPGGSGTAYQAFSCALPQIGLPINIDQEDSINQAVRLKTAICINPYRELSKEKILSAIYEILNNKVYKESAKKMQKIIVKYESVSTTADLIEDFIKSKNH